MLFPEPGGISSSQCEVSLSIIQVDGHSEMGARKVLQAAERCISVRVGIHDVFSSTRCITEEFTKLVSLE